MNIYKEHGYKDRNDYLLAMSEEYDVNIDAVTALAWVYWPEEDFDGLVTALEDMS
jgi:hypothetical protein